MRKKIVAITTLIIIFAMLVTCLVACDGATGATGKSAYELAVEQGFEGTLDEWLASLKGADGHNGIDGKDGVDGAVSIREIYEKEVADGRFSGDYSDFLQSYLNSEDIQYASQIALSSAVRVQAKGLEKVGLASSREITSYGSGVIYKMNKQGGDAYIITNYHVVYNSKFLTSDKMSDDISVFLYGESDEQAIPATYIGGAKDNDIAILKVSDSDIIKNSDAKAVKVANIKDVAVGATVIAVGCPGSSNAKHNFSVTKGIISVDREVITVKEGDYEIKALQVMRVDAAINSGNSGGGLFNARGQLVGIVNAKESSTSIDNMGYAIPIDVVVAIADYAIANYDV